MLRKPPSARSRVPAFCVCLAHPIHKWNRSLVKEKPSMNCCCSKPSLGPRNHDTNSDAFVSMERNVFTLLLIWETGANLLFASQLSKQREDRFSETMLLFLPADIYLWKWVSFLLVDKLALQCLGALALWFFCLLRMQQSSSALTARGSPAFHELKLVNRKEKLTFWDRAGWISSPGCKSVCARVRFGHNEKVSRRKCLTKGNT